MEHVNSVVELGAFLLWNLAHFRCGTWRVFVVDGLRGQSPKIPACTFNETLAADESLVCRDGHTWKVVVTATGKARRKGTLSVPMPMLSGSTPFAFSGEVPADKSCVVEILKEYCAVQ